MKRIETICDRCKQPVISQDARFLDLLETEYPGHDLCPDCYLILEAAGTLAKITTLTGESPKAVLSRWMALYDDVK